MTEGNAVLRDRSSETTAAGVSWTLFHAARTQYRERWPSVWSLPVMISFLDLVPRTNASGIRSVLDVGATTRVWEASVRKRFSGADYRSLDIDRTHHHDYYAFEALDRAFDLVMCIEVLEHVAPQEAIGLLTQCMNAAAPGGWVVVSVPNVLTPGVQLEFTHQTAFSFLDLPGLMKWVGLDVVTGARFCNMSTRRRLLHQYLLAPLHRAMKIDYCQMIVMLGRKPPGAPHALLSVDGR